MSLINLNNLWHSTVCADYLKLKQTIPLHCKITGYLGELVQAEDLLAVDVAMATLIHQLLELHSNLVIGYGKHRKIQQAANR